MPPAVAEHRDIRQQIDMQQALRLKMLQGKLCRNRHAFLKMPEPAAVVDDQCMFRARQRTVTAVAADMEVNVKLLLLPVDADCMAVARRRTLPAENTPVRVPVDPSLKRMNLASGPSVDAPHGNILTGSTVGADSVPLHMGKIDQTLRLGNQPENFGFPPASLTASVTIRTRSGCTVE